MSWIFSFLDAPLDPKTLTTLTSLTDECEPWCEGSISVTDAFSYFAAEQDDV
jgi:hypothetical protein